MLTYKPKNVYSFPEAAKMLHVAFKTLYRYANKGQLKYITYKYANVDHKGLHLDEINRLMPIFNPPANLQTVYDFRDTMKVDYNAIKRAIKDLHIQPKLKYDRHQISPKTDYYAKADLMDVNQYLYDHKGQYEYINPKTGTKASLAINTTILYDSKKHINMNQLTELLGPKVNTRTVYQWIIYGHIQNYQIDLHGRIYFTKEQAKAIKDRYLNIPVDAYINNKQLAAKMQIDPSALIGLRKQNNIPVYKVLGSNQTYYSKSNAKKLMDIYQQKPHRKRNHRRLNHD